MAVGVIAQLETQAAQSTATRIASEMAERACQFALETAKAKAAASARRRVELTEALAATQAAEDGSRDRLGDVRLQHASAAREAERLADLAADGSDPAGRALGKARDTSETLGVLTRAHERRTAAAAGLRERAEHLLAEHDADADLNDQRARESLLTQVAALVDRRLEESGSAAVQFTSLLDDARAARIRTAWAVAWISNAPMKLFLHAAHHFADWLEPGHATSGGGGRLFWPWSRFAQDFIASWRAGRGEDAGGQPAEPALAATVEHPAEAA